MNEEIWRPVQCDGPLPWYAERFELGWGVHCYGFFYTEAECQAWCDAHNADVPHIVHDIGGEG